MAVKYTHDMVLYIKGKQVNTNMWIWNNEIEQNDRKYEGKDKFECLHSIVLKSPEERSYSDGSE